MTGSHYSLNGAVADDHGGRRAQSDSSCGRRLRKDLSVALPSRALASGAG